MDYSKLFSEVARVGLIHGGSGAAPPPPGLVSFVFGLPDAASFPTGELEVVTAKVLGQRGAEALQYGAAQGMADLREYLADRLNEREGLALAPSQLAVTNGSSQAIGLIAQLLLDPGDTMLVEAPTFLGAVRVFRLSLPRVEELPVDDQGLIVTELERRVDELAAEGVRPKFLYTMPTFHNPTGVTMPLDRRLELLRVAAKHQFLVIEDDAYGDLRYEGADLPSLLALDRDGLVIRFGTFSKILAAGLRLGWMAGPAAITEAMPGIKADGGTNPYASLLANEWARDGYLEPHVQKLRGIYRERRDAMLESLERFCAPYCRWTRPEGGFFVWLTLDEKVDPAALKAAAQDEKVAYLPGPLCFASGTGERNLRLSFSFVEAAAIREGIERLGRAMARAAG